MDNWIQGNTIWHTHNHHEFKDHRSKVMVENVENPIFRYYQKRFSMFKHVKVSGVRVKIIKGKIKVTGQVKKCDISIFNLLPMVKVERDPVKGCRSRSQGQGQGQGRCDIWLLS